MRRMLKEEPWPEEAVVEAALAREALPSDANGLNAMAWPLVDSESGKSVYGGEIRGLLLARRAVTAASAVELPAMLDTLAHALFRCGRLDEALAEADRAVAEAGESSSAELSVSRESLRKAVASWRPEGEGSTLPEHRRNAEELPARIAQLEQGITDRRTWEFDAGEDTWWQAQLARLVSEIQEFEDAERGGLFSNGVSEPHGWGIPRRAEFARTIRLRSLESDDARRRWQQAIAAMGTNIRYAGLALSPQIGLLPIGEDPDSHLQEFAHLATGEPAERGADGRIVLKEETGLVLVLVPGGTFPMGAQKQDPSGANYDPNASPNESPVRDVALSSFFLSKYETTQAQWLRAMGKNPSTYNPTTRMDGKYLTGLHPVEQVSWNDATRFLERVELLLPTEAQWEYGARAGTTTPWWTGAEKESLRGAANLRDAHALSHGFSAVQSSEPWLEDGFTVHAPVGSFRANGFGLHDVVGNLCELCREHYGRYDLPVREGDGERIGTTLVSRMIRGSSYFSGSGLARAAARADVTPDYRDFTMGFRPALAITPP